MYKIRDNSKTAAPLNASWMTVHESCKPEVHCLTCKQLHIGECPFQAAQLVSASSRLLVFERVSYQSLTIYVCLESERLCESCQFWELPDAIESFASWVLRCFLVEWTISPPLRTSRISRILMSFPPGLNVLSQKKSKKPKNQKTAIQQMSKKQHLIVIWVWISLWLVMLAVFSYIYWPFVCLLRINIC